MKMLGEHYPMPAFKLPVKWIAGLRTLWYLLSTYYSIRDSIMNRETFSNLRAKLGKTQKTLSGLLGVSLKAVQSYEQGWRSIPIHVERQLYFLAVSQRGDSHPKRKDCWTIKKCERKKECPAWEFQAGHLCWFLSGTLCACAADKNWKEKMAVCRDCEVLTSLL
jgi:DNA-binding XRE family transcriptional regulator